MIRFLSLLALLGFCLWAPPAYKRITHGFYPAKCVFQKEDAFSTFFEEKEKELAREILRRPFTYLAKGRESFVFISEDGAYVLKLFRSFYSKMHYGKKIELFLSKLFSRKEDSCLSYFQRVQKMKDSCKVASFYAKDLTGLIYIYTDPKKDEMPEIRLKDRMGRNYKLDPKSFRFVLQKRGELLVKSLTELLQKNDVTSLKRMVCSFDLYLKKMEALGIYNKDPTFSRNFGLFDGQIMAFDFGDFTLDPNLSKECWENYMVRLKKWLEKRGYQD